jgi:hypothetical protein
MSGHIMKSKKNSEDRPELAEWAQYDQKKCFFGRFLLIFV